MGADAADAPDRMAGTAVNGTRVVRRVIFQGKCDRGTCVLAGWSGPERSAKWEAASDIAMHEIDRHGGAERGTQ